MKFKIFLALILALGQPLSAEAQPSLQLTATGSHALDALDGQGNFWGTWPGTDSDPVVGKQIVKFSGPDREHLSATRYSGSFIDRLMPKGSNTAHNATGAGGYVEQVWPLPDGTVLFSTQVAGYSYLYKLKPNTNSVGNNKPQYNNRQAVFNIGERAGKHYANIRALHHRSLAVATIKRKTVLFLGEYNLNNTAPHVALWRSDNLGDTWSKVVEWNTVGHQIRHIHGVVQNPYNGWIYILLGDDDAESGIIAWNGVATAPPNNTPLTQFNRYPGWKAISGSKSVRTADILFTPPPQGKCVWIPDVDFVAPGEIVTAQRANYDLSSLEATHPIPYTNGFPPILGYRDPHTGYLYWSSFRIQGNESTIQLWSSNDTGLHWTLAAKVNTYNNWTSVPHNLYKAPWGEILVTARDMEFVNGGLSFGSTAYLTAMPTLAKINTAPMAYDDAAITTQNKPVTIAVLANDSDKEANIAVNSVRIVNYPTQGNLTVNADGNVIYNPNANSAGTDTFSYQIKDALGLNSATANVVITLLAAKGDAYQFSANNAYTQVLDLKNGGVALNDLPQTDNLKPKFVVTSPLERVEGQGKAMAKLFFSENGDFYVSLQSNAGTTTGRVLDKRGRYQFSYVMQFNNVVTLPAKVTLVLS